MSSSVWDTAQRRRLLARCWVEALHKEHESLDVPLRRRLTAHWVLPTAYSVLGLVIGFLSWLLVEPRDAPRRIESIPGVLVTNNQFKQLITSVLFQHLSDSICTTCQTVRERLRPEPDDVCCSCLAVAAVPRLRQAVPAVNLDVSAVMDRSTLGSGVPYS